jgi:U3 small nucleolar RNA-associated protein 11
MDVVKLLKTQDVGYIRTMLQMVRKEREELEQKMVLADEKVMVLRDGEEGKTGRHTVYVGDANKQTGWSEKTWFGTGAECPTWNRRRRDRKIAELQQEDEAEAVPKKLSKKQKEAQDAAKKEEKMVMKKRARTQERATAHLEAVKARERDLMTAEEELEKQRAKMNSNVGGTNKDGVKFKIRERKR